MLGHSKVVCGDAEFGTDRFGRIVPLCLDAVELYSGKRWSLWQDELFALDKLPFPTDESTLFVAFSASAEIQVFLALGVPLPRHICDPMLEYRALVNGRRAKVGTDSFLEVLAAYDIVTIDAGEKTQMRAMAGRGPPWYGTAEEKARMQAYNHVDVEGLTLLMPRMGPEIERRFHRDEVLFRGRSTVAFARSHRVGQPIDSENLAAIVENREAIKVAVATAAEAKHGWGIYDDNAGFSHDGYDAWVAKNKFPIPLTDTGRYAVQDKIFEGLETGYPDLIPFRNCRNTLKVLNKISLTVDADGYSRPYMNWRGSITGRNQPGSTTFIFSLPKLFRHLLMPKEGMSLAYADARAQEWLIAAVHSGDARALADYRDGDVHMRLAIALGFAPKGATKADKRYSAARNRAKTLNFGILYGKTKFGLARDLRITIDEANEYLHQCADTYPDLFRYRQSIVNGSLRPDQTYFTALGWPFWTGGLKRKYNKNEPGRDFRTMYNFPMQAGGCDWMTAVLIGATEAGLQVCCTVHDGILITAPTEKIDADLDLLIAIMRETSVRLFGEPLIIDCDRNSPDGVVHWPNRFVPDDKQAQDMWALVQQELHKIRQQPTEEAA
jgi:DNA polymerase I